MLKPEIEDGTRSLADPAFRADVLAGLAAPPARDPGALVLRPARLGTVRGDHRPARILSDPHRDARLLERICRRGRATIAGTGRAVVEFGSGSSTKTPILLARGRPRGLCADRHFGRFPARIADGAGRALSRPAGLPVEADFMQPDRAARAQVARRCPSSASSPARRSAT